MSTLPEPLKQLALAYERYLSEGEINSRLAHHLCHVAAEQWFSHELAYTLNNDSESLGMSGWHAHLEQNNRVDVSIVPPVGVNNGKSIHIEMKLVPPRRWNPNWDEVYHDLAIHPSKPAKKRKPAAAFAVCILEDIVWQKTGKRRRGTAEKYSILNELVPIEPGVFCPMDRFPNLLLRHSSPAISVSWPHVVPGRLPDGYDATVRIVWVSVNGPVTSRPWTSSAAITSRPTSLRAAHDSSNPAAFPVEYGDKRVPKKVRKCNAECFLR